MKKNILIYADEGAGTLSLLAVRNYFSAHNTRLIKANDIIKNGIPQETDLFVMPGGADKTYAQKLNGAGNQKIKNYVEQGGTYLGICAGAYYGCSAIEFQKGTSSEICEDRELSFYHGIGTGCISEITQPYDLTLKSAAVTEIGINECKEKTFYWGGCHFENTPHNAEVIARYSSAQRNPPAIISCNVGKGSAILSGVHFEITSEVLLDYDFDNEADNHLKQQLAQDLKESEPLNFDHLFFHAERKAA